MIVARKTFRIGVQTLEREGDRWFVSIRNRTYASRVEVTAAKADYALVDFERLLTHLERAERARDEWKQRCEDAEDDIEFERRSKD